MITVHICDPTDEQINDMLDYCRDNSLSLNSFETLDVSDVSGRFDTICIFQFKDDSDATIFKLKYK